MSDPIKIIVQAETQAAAAELQKFAAQQGSGLSAKLSASAKEAENLGKKLGNARMGLMQLEHTARASTDILLMGGNTRMLLAQIPQLLQSLTEMGVGLSTLLPWVAAVGAAVGAGYLGWREYMSGVNDATEEVKQMTDALDKLPDLLKEIQSLTKSGLISEAAGTEFADYLGKNPKKKLYRHSDGTISPIATETVMEFPHTGDPFVDQRAIAVTKKAPEANEAEASKYVQQQMIITAAQTKAAQEYHAAITKANEDIASGLDKEITQIHDRYSKEIDDLRVKFEAAFKMGLIGPNEQKAALNQISELQAAEAAAVAQARQKYAAEQARKDRTTLTQWQTTQKQMVAAQEKALEDAILAQREQTKDKSIPLYQQEFAARTELYRRELDQGIITEDQLVQKVQSANEKRLAGEKAFQAELQKTAQLQMELARSQAEAQLHTIQSNPFLSSQAKASASVGPIQGLLGANARSIASYHNIAASTNDEAARIQALTKVNELTQQQVDLQRQLDAAKGEQSFTYQLGLSVTHLQEMNNLAKETASAFQGVFSSAIADVSRGITGLIMGTMTWRQFLAEIPRQILTEIVNAIVEMGIRWVATQIMMATVGKAIQAAAVAGNAPVAAATAALWSPAATLSTIATFGASAAAAPGLITLAEGLTLATVGFKSGGYTGDGDPNEIAGFVHKREFVVPADTVRRVGLSNLQAAMHNGGSGNATAGAVGGGQATNLHFWDKRPHPQEYLGSSAGTHQIIEIVRQNRQRIGIKT